MAFIALVIVLKLVHFRHLQYKVLGVIIILAILFIYLTFSGVVKNNSIDVKNISNFFGATKLYFSWLGHAFSNMGQITGNVAKMDWMPRNITG